MIRQAVETDFGAAILDECAIRIHSLRRAYGIDVPFIRYYADDHGSLLSIMDGTAILYCETFTDEWQLFLSMNPDISRIHCSAIVGRQLMNAQQWQGREGVVLRYNGISAVTTAQVCEMPNLPAVHSLLSACFDEMSPLDAWYPDVSHRLRHNCAKIATVFDGDTVISTAMTVAETDTAALIGQVATRHNYRGQGLAKACINSLISRCKEKTLYILPMTDIARSLYERMGFTPCGEWAELQRV